MREPVTEQQLMQIYWSIPMKRALAMTCTALAMGAQTAPAQQGVPIVNLPPATARTATMLGVVIGIHEVAGGKVLVNDAGHRQLKLFDTTLATSTLVADSTSGNSNSYGPAPVALIRYLGDSSLFPDLSSETLLVLDGGGQVVRAIALPNAGDFPAFVIGFSGSDNKGRLFYRGTQPLRSTVSGAIPTVVPGDSIPILRADLDQRRVDTVGRIKVRDGNSQVVDRSDLAKTKITLTINPLPSLDEWSVLSDGSVALVRAHDYHIDWVRPDGSTSSTPKLPFDWRRLTDDDKQKLVDSARAAQVAAAARRAANQSGAGSAGGGGSSGRGGGRGGDGADPGGRATPTQIDTRFLPLKDITDFYPPLRRGATMPDLDGNVWILPTTSAQSLNGELVYDVVNAKGVLFERVRLPAGRSLAGFGKGGVVYLLSGDPASGPAIGLTGGFSRGFYLERTRMNAH